MWQERSMKPSKRKIHGYLSMSLSEVKLHCMLYNKRGGVLILKGGMKKNRRFLPSSSLASDFHWTSYQK
jgi:hypothetical protein